MSTLEKEILEQVYSLSEDQQRNVLEYIQRIKSPSLKLGAWLKEIEALNKHFEERYGPNHFPRAADLIEELRGERLDDILGSR